MDKEVQSKYFELLNMDRYLFSSFIKNENKEGTTFQVPRVELFSSVSSISVAFYSKDYAHYQCMKEEDEKQQKDPRHNQY